MKRIIDLLVSIFGLFVLSPILIILILFVYLYDRQFPFYVASRVGKKGIIFKMVKIRSMHVGSDLNGVSSTSNNDNRITPLGIFIRKYKLDELTQLWNVFKGEMSLVGPRPNVLSAINMYTSYEKKLLKVKPGITDFASIVFSDEGEILNFSKNPDLLYDQLIRPWKSRLGIIYVEKNTVLLDLKLILYTIISIFSRKIALKLVTRELKNLDVDKEVLAISSRNKKLYPLKPPE